MANPEKPVITYLLIWEKVSGVSISEKNLYFFSLLIIFSININSSKCYKIKKTIKNMV